MFITFCKKIKQSKEKARINGSLSIFCIGEGGVSCGLFPPSIPSCLFKKCINVFELTLKLKRGFSLDRWPLVCILRVSEGSCAAVLADKWRKLPSINEFAQ